MTTEFQVGDQAVIVDDPVSLTVGGYAGCEATVIRVISISRSSVPHNVVEIQVSGKGPVGRRQILTVDLKPAGQLRMF